jgi:hypothetical protein
LGILPAEPFIERVDERDGELGNGGTLGAKLAEEEPLWEVPVGDVGDVPLGGPGLFEPPFLPPPLNRPLLFIVSKYVLKDERETSINTSFLSRKPESCSCPWFKPQVP